MYFALRVKHFMVYGIQGMLGLVRSIKDAGFRDTGGHVVALSVANVKVVASRNRPGLGNSFLSSTLRKATYSNSFFYQVLRSKWQANPRRFVIKIGA